MNSTTWVDFTEEMIAEVVSELADDVELVMEVLSPDGRPYGQKEMDDEAKVAKYVQDYRGQPEAWANLARTQVQQAQQQLQQMGLPPDKIMAAHLHNEVLARAFAYSFEMEQLIKKQEESATSGSAFETGVTENGSTAPE